MTHNPWEWGREAAEIQRQRRKDRRFDLFLFLVLVAVVAFGLSALVGCKETPAPKA